MVKGITGGLNGMPDMSQMWQQFLKQVDKDGDGKISQAEFSGAAPTNGKGSNSGDLFAKIDTNGDGAIDKDEMQAAFQEMQPPQPPGIADPLALFKAADKDGDGKISLDEFKAMFQPKEADTGPDAEEVFDQMDTNQDGMVSAAEFMAAMQKAAQAAFPVMPEGFSTLA